MSNLTLGQVAQYSGQIKALENQLNRPGLKSFQKRIYKGQLADLRAKVAQAESPLTSATQSFGKAQELLAAQALKGRQVAPAAAHIPAPKGNGLRNLGILALTALTGAAAYLKFPTQVTTAATTVGNGLSMAASATGTGISMAGKGIMTAFNATAASYATAKPVVAAKFTQAVNGTASAWNSFNSSSVITSATSTASSLATAYPFTAGQTLTGLGAFITGCIIAKKAYDMVVNRASAPAAQPDVEAEPEAQEEQKAPAEPNPALTQARKALVEANKAPHASFLAVEQALATEQQ